jgi:hypothetical protein
MKSFNLMAASAVAFLLVVALAIPAEARSHHRHYSHVHHHATRIALAESNDCVPDNNGRCAWFGTISRTSEARRGGQRVTGFDDGSIIGGRPSGCPHAYCGCGLRLYLGISDPRLNLAWNWARFFPRASPGPGMAVVWGHHVALIERMVGPREAILRDYNSGGGLSRVHERSIAGAVVVNPNARTAMR